jgi:hypothetical protein
MLQGADLHEHHFLYKRDGTKEYIRRPLEQ